MISHVFQKEVILYGAGNRARQFYAGKNDKICIKCCLSNDVKSGEEMMDHAMGIRIKNPADYIPTMHKNEFIVICVDDYLCIEKQLIAYGLRAGVDYLHYRLFHALASGKKIALLYGVCYMRPIGELLKRSTLFFEEYEIYYYLSYKRMAETEYALFDFLLSICDLYIYNPTVSREEQMVTQGCLYRLKKGCQIMKIPSVGGSAYHPQTVKPRTAGISYSFVPEGAAYGPFTSQDWNINRMIDEGKSLYEIRSMISNKNFYSPELVIENYETQFRMIELRECDADVRISDFLREQHRKTRIFRDGIHLGNVPICELANRMLEHLGFEREDYSNAYDEMLIYSSEVPLYPSVIETLQLDLYAEGDPLYALFTFRGYQKVTFDEYLELYYEYSLCMRHHLKKGYFYER